jgi:hypothetical protein
MANDWAWSTTLLRAVAGDFTSEVNNGILIPSAIGDASILHGNKLQWIQALVVPSNDAGDRKFKFQILDANVRVIWQANCATLVANQSIRFNFARRARRSDADIGGSYDYFLPDITVPQGGFIRFFDAAGIDPNDTVTLRGECRAAGSLARIGFGG